MASIVLLDHELFSFDLSCTQPTRQSTCVCARRVISNPPRGQLTIKVDNHVAPDLAVLQARAVAHLNAVRNDTVVEFDAENTHTATAVMSALN